MVQEDAPYQRRSHGFHPATADVYPVGLLRDIRQGRVRGGLRTYLWGYCIRGRRWRAARSYFNGYLAEHDGHPHNCGRGWTKRAALRRVERMCEHASASDPRAGDERA